MGLQLKFETDGKAAFTKFTPREEHIGFKNVIHGGILATLLDEIMVWACVVQTRKVAYCAELTVRFQNPVRPGETLSVKGELVTNRKNKLFETRAEVCDAQGKLLAAATGKYLSVSETEAAAMMADLWGAIPEPSPT